MSSHFQFYVSNLKRVRLNQLIDYYTTQLRYQRARPSLIFNPLSERPNPESAPESQDRLIKQNNHTIHSRKKAPAE
jgi:hypothetical protein